MVTINISHNIGNSLRLLDDRLRRQVPFAMSRTINQVAKVIQFEVQAAMSRDLDRPTPFVLKSVFVKYSNKQNLKAAVFIRDRELSKNPYSIADIIRQQFQGGPRIRTRLEGALTRAGLISNNEFVAPGAGAKLDRYGNLSRGQIQQLLSQIFASSNSEANRTGSARSRLSVRRAGRIFWSRGGHLPRGAYIDDGTRIRPLLMVVSAPQYRKRIYMHEIAQRVVDKDFNRFFKVEFENAVRSAR